MASGSPHNDVFQRIANRFFNGKRNTALILFFCLMLTMPWLAIIGLVVLNIVCREEPGQASRRANPVPPPRPVERPASRPAPRAEPRPQPKAPAKPQPAVPKPKHTGDAEADRLLDACHDFLCASEEYLPDIEDIEVRAKVKEACARLKGIMSWVQNQPDSASSASRLSSYYLPTTLKLLKTYTAVDDTPGPNAKAICEQISRTLDTLNQALENLQNNMLDTAAMDVEAEISAMEQMLGCEGLTGDFKMPGGEKEQPKQ